MSILDHMEYEHIEQAVILIARHPLCEETGKMITLAEADIAMSYVAGKITQEQRDKLLKILDDVENRIPTPENNIPVYPTPQTILQWKRSSSV